MSRSEAHDARNRSIRDSMSSTDKARANAIPDSETLTKTAQQLNIAHEVQEIPNSEGAKIHWFGDRSARKVILYFHGGGFGLPSFPGHLIFLNQCIERLEAKGQKGVIAFLEYGLTKAKKYPTQYMQITESLRLVLQEGYHPSDIVIGGDSAGGNMCIALMSLLLHPHPDIPALKLESPIAGLLLICSWVSYQSNAESFKTNKDKDIHEAPQMHQWADDFCTEEERNKYTEPIRADSDWFRGLPAKSVLNVWGGYELFRDDCEAFGKLLEAADVSVRNMECPQQVHIDCILDAQSQLDTGLMSTEVWEWLGKVM